MLPRTLFSIGGRGLRPSDTGFPARELPQEQYARALRPIAGGSLLVVHLPLHGGPAPQAIARRHCPPYTRVLVVGMAGAPERSASWDLPVRGWTIVAPSDLPRCIDMARACPARVELPLLDWLPRTVVVCSQIVAGRNLT